jgi:hypothetical protein
LIVITRFPLRKDHWGQPILGFVPTMKSQLSQLP